MAGRRWQYETGKYFLGIGVALFKLLPRFMATFLFGLFRWSESVFGYGIRYLCIRRLARSCGPKVIIGPGTFIYFPERMDIGTNVSINQYCHIQAAGDVKIGNNVLIAHQCTIMSGDHRFDVPGKIIRESGETLSPIVIGDDVWLGAAVRVMQGITIGTGSVIGAGGVVTRDIPPGQIALGIPAKVVRPRFPDESPESILDPSPASPNHSSSTISE